MTLEKNHGLIVMHDDDKEAVDALIRGYGIEKQWEIKPGTIFASAFKS